MIEGFGVILERLQGFLGKSYLLTGFFPVLLFAIVSIPLIPLVAPEFPFVVQDFIALPVVEQTLIGLGLLLTTAFLGFFLYLLNPSFRRRFEDGALRPIIRPWFIDWQRFRAEQLKGKIDKERPDLVAYRLNVRDLKWRTQLREARIEGRTQGKGPVSDKLLDGLEKMERLRAKREPIPFTYAQTIFDLALEELKKNDADEVPELDRTHLRFWNLAVYAHQAAEVAFDQLHYEMQRQFPRDLSRIGPTALANVNRAHEDAIWERYQMNGELFWPIIEKIASSDEKFEEMLRNVRLRMDFPISMAAASLLFTAFWLIAFYVNEAPRWIFCLMLLVGPSLAILFYWVGFWNAYALNATVRMTIDLFRFNALVALHIALPRNSSEEAALWSKLTALEELSEGNVDFQHETGSTRAAENRTRFE